MLTLWQKYFILEMVTFFHYLSDLLDGLVSLEFSKKDLLTLDREAAEKMFTNNII